MPTTLQTVAHVMEANRHFSWEVMARKVVEAMRDTPVRPECGPPVFWLRKCLGFDPQRGTPPKENEIAVEFWREMFKAILSEPQPPAGGAP